MRKREIVNKKQLRKEILAQRDALTEKERREKSKRIGACILEMDVFEKSNKLLLYASMRSEVETDEIYHDAKKAGKKIYYPRVLGDKMEFYRVEDICACEKSVFGVREPQMESNEMFIPDDDDVILVLMPGVAFDQEGNRIGYGGGYYDKYLQWLQDSVKSENICKVALAYECQMMGEEKIEREVHDVRPDYIVTEANVYTI